MVVKNQKALLKNLKKQVRVLQKKEEQHRKKLKAALGKMRKLARVYKSKFTSKMRVMQNKIAHSKAMAYAKVAADIERQLMKSMKSKGEAIVTSLMKVEKKQLAKFNKRVSKKMKKSKKRR